jgi:uncharacterized protein (TIRG00374 family)
MSVDKMPLLSEPSIPLDARHNRAMPDAADQSAGEPAETSLPAGDHANPTVDVGTARRPETAKKPKPRWRRVVGALLSLALILFIFFGVIPQFANYQDAWNAISNMSAGWWVAIFAAATFNQISSVWPYQAALAHLRFRHGFMETQTSTAIANTVPAGGAVSIGITFAMFGSFGFTNVSTSTAVATTGIWNLAFKFGLPIVALVLVAVTGQSTGGAVGAASLGVLIVAVSGVVLWLVFRSDTSAHRVGRMGDRVLNWVLHFFHKPKSDRLEPIVLHFREQTNEMLCKRGGLLTVSVLASQLAVFVVLLFSVRAVGISSGQVSFLEVLLSFAVARLVGAIPITPGGLGTVDAALIGMLTAFGASSNNALAADMVWRATTYFPPIFIGSATYLLWKRGLARGIYAQRPDVVAAPVIANR